MCSSDLGGKRRAVRKDRAGLGGRFAAIKRIEKRFAPEDESLAVDGRPALCAQHGSGVSGDVEGILRILWPVPITRQAVRAIASRNLHHGIIIGSRQYSDLS